MPVFEEPPFSQDEGLRPLPAFITFEARAADAGLAGLREAVDRITRPENAFDTEEKGGIWMGAAIPYAHILCDSEEPLDSICAAFNGIYFATVVSSRLVGSRLLPPYPSHFCTEVGRDERRQNVRSSATDYLQTCPTLRSWIEDEQAHLDQTGEYYDIVQAVAAVTLQDMEEQDRQGFIDTETAWILGNSRLPGLD